MARKFFLDHFKNRDNLSRLVETQAKGIVSWADIHGTEIPGHIFAGADAARETSVALLLLWILLSHFKISFAYSFEFLVTFSLGWLIWKVGRSAWLGWSRLERMNRIIEEERWEIEHRRGQERAELRELYRAKGFQGQLLEDVLDVLMADEERVLREMVTEELRLCLETQEHPLKQGLGGGIGVLVTSLVSLLFLLVSPLGIWFACFLTLSSSALIFAHLEKNKLLPALIWNLGLGALALGSVYFLSQYLNF